MESFPYFSERPSLTPYLYIESDVWLRPILKTFSNSLGLSWFQKCTLLPGKTEPFKLSFCQLGQPRMSSSSEEQKINKNTLLFFWFLCVLPPHTPVFISTLCNNTSRVETSKLWFHIWPYLSFTCNPCFPSLKRFVLSWAFF